MGRLFDLCEDHLAELRAGLAGCRAPAAQARRIQEFLDRLHLALLDRDVAPAESRFLRALFTALKESFSLLAPQGPNGILSPIAAFLRGGSRRGNFDLESLMAGVHNCMHQADQAYGEFVAARAEGAKPVLTGALKEVLQQLLEAERLNNGGLALRHIERIPEILADSLRG